MKCPGRKPWFLVLALFLITGFVPAVPADGAFTLEQVLSAPYPTNLVSAKSADRIAWVFNSEGTRNIWTAAGPDFTPVNLTGYGRDEVFEIPSVDITADGSIIVYVRGGTPTAAAGSPTRRATRPESSRRSGRSGPTAEIPGGSVPETGRPSLPTAAGSWSSGMTSSPASRFATPVRRVLTPEPELLFRAAAGTAAPSGRRPDPGGVCQQPG